MKYQLKKRDGRRRTEDGGCANLRSIPTLLAYSFLLIFITSCKKENMCDCIKSTGDIVTEHRSIPDFTQLEVYENVVVTLVQDTVVYADVEAGDNLLPLIETEVSGGILRITNNNKCNWVRSYKKEIHATVHVRDLRHVLHYGSKEINSQNAITSPVIDILNYNCGDVHLKLQSDLSYARLMNADGDIYLDGYSRYSYVYGGSFGFAHTQNLQNDSCFVDQRASGNIYVKTNKWFSVTISDIGDVYYSGNPVISSSLSGKGRLIHE